MKPEHTAVALQQQELLAMIFSMNHLAEENKSDAFSKGLKIYQNNLLMTAARALSLSYPVLERMLGEEAVVALARELLRRAPPQDGDWGEWGGELDALIVSTSLIDEHPYLADVARLEWLIHRASRSAAPALQVDSLSRLSEPALESVYLRLSASIGLLHSPFPVDILWTAHQSNGEPFRLDQRALKRALAKQSSEPFLMVFQQNQVAHMKRISLAEFRWLEDVQRGLNVSALFDRHPDFDFIQWLSVAVRDGVLEKLD